MELLDRLALTGRRHERRRSVITGSPSLDLHEILREYDHKAILDAAIWLNGKRAKHLTPDPERKLKLSLLDMLSELQPAEGSWYEVFETAPTGDVTKVRIAVYTRAGKLNGELRMLMGRRTMDNYFLEDPVFESIKEATEPV